MPPTIQLQPHIGMLAYFNKVGKEGWKRMQRLGISVASLATPYYKQILVVYT
jgi:hypothetical protein